MKKIQGPVACTFFISYLFYYIFFYFSFLSKIQDFKDFLNGLLYFKLILSALCWFKWNFFYSIYNFDIFKNAKALPLLISNNLFNLYLLYQWVHLFSIPVHIFFENCYLFSFYIFHFLIKFLNSNFSCFLTKNVYLKTPKIFNY